MAAHAESYHGNLRRGFLVGGNSGGGTFAAIATHLARDEDLSPCLTGSFLSCPILTDEMQGSTDDIVHRFGAERNRSHETNKDAPLMDRATQLSIREFAAFDWRSPYLTPFNFSTQSGLPPMYLQLCGLDPWRDTGKIYAEEIEAAGGKVRLSVYPGLPHCWWTTFPMLKVSEKYVTDLIEGVRWLLDASEGECTSSKL